MNLHKKAMLAITTGAMNVNFVAWHLIVLAVSPSDVPSDNDHDAFEVVIPDLPFEDSFPQNFMQWR